MIFSSLGSVLVLIYVLLLTRVRITRGTPDFVEVIRGDFNWCPQNTFRLLTSRLNLL